MKTSLALLMSLGKSASSESKTTVDASSETASNLIVADAVADTASSVAVAATNAPETSLPNGRDRLI